MTILLKVFVHNNSQYLRGVNALNNIDANYYRDITNKKKILLLLCQNHFTRFLVPWVFVGVNGKGTTLALDHL